MRGDLAELSRLRTFNQWMGTGLLSLDDVPVEMVELALAWAAQNRRD